VDQLVESLGLRISRSEVSRIRAGLDEQVQALREPTGSALSDNPAQLYVALTRVLRRRGKAG